MAEYKKTEVLTIGQIALGFLTSDISVTLPTKIHDMLQNVLTKRSGNMVRYRDCIVQKQLIKNPTGRDTKRHEVILGRNYAIFNILCLYVIMDTKHIKLLFHHYYETRHNSGKREFAELLNQQKKSQYLAYFCFGIDVNKINVIEDCLLDSSFDLFTQKLPLPFSDEQINDLSPLLIMINDDIDWESYYQLYQEAEDCFERKEYDRVKLLLIQLEQQAVLTLPIVGSLQRKMFALEEESQDALNYLQQMLN